MKPSRGASAGSTTPRMPRQGTKEEGPLVCTLLSKAGRLTCRRCSQELEGTRFENYWISQDGKGGAHMGPLDPLWGAS